MQKKIISVIIALSLVISSVSFVYAVDISTPQAIKLDKSLTLNTVRGSALLQAASDTVVAPSVSNYVYKYWTGSTIQNVSGSLSTWGGLISPITDSIASSIQSLYLKIYPYIDTIESKLETSNNQVGNIASDIRAIKGYLNFGGVSIGSDVYKINNNVHDMKGDLQTLTEVITSGGAFDVQPIVDALNHSDFVGESYSGSLSQTIWQSNDNGTWTTFNQNVSQARRFQNLLIFLTALQRNQALANASLRRGAGNDVITNNDLTTSSIASQSVQQTLQNYGTNISSLLARLSFVLASDEEIEARQAAEDNTSAVVDDFIKPAGSGSASASDFADVASIGGTMKDALSSNVGAENAFTSLDSDSEAWDWFSQSIADSLDSSSSSSRKSLKSNYYPTPMLDSYYSQLMETLKVKDAR